jgi:deazaflavin-dependent oxidoreductase (nitroreductase family)
MRRVARVEGEIVIGRPVEEVYDFVADERNEPRYNPRMVRAEKVTPGPIGVGTRFAAQMKGRRPIDMTIEFTDFERPRRLASHTRLAAMDIRGALTFDPVAHGTRMRWAWELQPRGVLRLLGPIVARVGARQERVVWAGLKRLLEAPGAANPPTVGALPTAGRSDRSPRLPPRWFIRLFWVAHRRLYRLTRGRVGLWRPKPGKWGALRLTAIGRRTGREHAVLVGYFEDGANLVTLAMNGWGDAEPAWWLNLQAHPDAQADLPDGPRLVRGRAARGDERERLWSRWREIDRNLDAYAARRSRETAVVILEPRPAP